VPREQALNVSFWQALTFRLCHGKDGFVPDSVSRSPATSVHLA